MTDARPAADVDSRPGGSRSSSEPGPGRGGVPRWVARAPVLLLLAGLSVAWLRNEGLVPDGLAVAVALVSILGVSAFVLLAVVMARREHG